MTSPIDEPTPEAELFVSAKDRAFITKDHQLSEELIILEGLNTAVEKGWITEDEKHEWLNEYIDKRNAKTDS